MSDSDPSGSSSRNVSGRLAASGSPYLRQHADNPVDWYPWGTEAFDRSRSTDRPMFISIGYATCHWCHVMERESFENESIAAVLNDGFVAVKVDREEHPDVDHFYMTACTAGGRRGGWPLTILALPDARPFYAATYLPPSGSGGRAGLIDVLQRVSELWASDREAVEAAASDVTGLVQRLEEPPGDGQTSPMPADVAGLTKRTLERMRSEYDPAHGGFGRAPKFPVFHRLRFLMEHSEGGEHRMALETMRLMRAGGIWDHVGHGFHRYSTDRHWHLPHFEKMLYDQAMALAAFAEAWAISGDPVFRTTVKQIGDALEQDFRLEDGLMASAWDADSEGEEGKFYVWTRAELESVVAEDSNRIKFLEDAYAVREEGNFTDEATGRDVASNILDAGYGRPVEDLGAMIERFEPVRRSLAEARAKRVHPLRDEKRLADWNGMYVAGAALAGRLTEASGLVEAALHAAERLMNVMRGPDGGMVHRKFGEDVGIEGGLDDYAMPALGCFELFEATGQARWLDETDRLIGALLDRFYDEEENVLRISRRADIPVAQTRLQDEAYPSGSGVVLAVIVKLTRLLDRPRFEACLDRVLGTGWTRIAEWPGGHLTVLGAAAARADRGGEIVVAAHADDPLSAIVRRSFTPSHVHVHAGAKARQDLARLIPWLEPLWDAVEVPAVFICTDRACERPVTDPEELQERLDGISPVSRDAR